MRSGRRSSWPRRAKGPSRASGSRRRRRSHRTSSRTSSPTCGTPGSSRAAAGPTAATGWRGRRTEVSLADVIRAVDGPLANVRGVRSEQVVYQGSAEKLRDVWMAVRASLRSVLEHVTLADLARGELPESVRAPGGRPRRLVAALARALDVLALVGTWFSPQAKPGSWSFAPPSKTREPGSATPATRFRRRRSP